MQVSGLSKGRGSNVPDPTRLGAAGNRADQRAPKDRTERIRGRIQSEVAGGCERSGYFYSAIQILDWPERIPRQAGWIPLVSMA